MGLNLARRWKQQQQLLQSSRHKFQLLCIQRMEMRNPGNMHVQGVFLSFGQQKQHVHSLLYHRRETAKSEWNVVINWDAKCINELTVWDLKICNKIRSDVAQWLATNLFLLNNLQFFFSFPKAFLLLCRLSKWENL